MRGREGKRVVGDEPESNWLLESTSQSCIAAGLTEAAQGSACEGPRETYDPVRCHPAKHVRFESLEMVERRWINRDMFYGWDTLLHALHLLVDNSDDRYDAC